MAGSATSTMLDREDKSLKSLFDRFGSVCSLEDIAAAFCKAGRDAHLAGKILCGMRTGLLETPNAVDGAVTSETSSTSSDENGFSTLCYAKTNGNSKALKSRGTPVSMGTVSSVIGKNYVWRPRSNGSTTGTKPLKVEGNKHSASVYHSEDSISKKDGNSPQNQDIENFLFDMLGLGFHLDRNAIREVLGQCGYDMKKSMDKLLDLTSATIDRTHEFNEASKLNTNSEILSSQEQVQKQKFAESGGSTLRVDGNPSGKFTKRHEQQKEILSALFHVPERPDATIKASKSASVRRSSATWALVTEPLEETVEIDAILAIQPVPNVKDDNEDDDYHLLRKAVKEYRNTMKEYYKAAAEAFSDGDRTRAAMLLEKGQFFYRKAREADEESAQKILETSKHAEVKDEISLDLQDHEPKEAISLVKCHLRSLAGIPSITNLKIVIGMGERGAERCKRLVKKLLERENIKWIEDESSGTIVVRLDEINPKRLSFATKQ